MLVVDSYFPFAYWHSFRKTHADCVLGVPLTESQLASILPQPVFEHPLVGLQGAFAVDHYGGMRANGLIEAIDQPSFVNVSIRVPDLSISSQ